MEIEKNIQDQWYRLFKYYEQNLSDKCDGINDEEVLKVEKEFDLVFPKNFKDSFKICDERYLFNNNKTGWFGKYELYPLSKSIYEGYNLIDINKELRMYHPSWEHNWIAFYDYESWFYAILDTGSGKVLLQSTEGGKTIVWANSYEEWFKMAVDEVVKYGELRLETIQSLLGIKSSDN